MTTPKDALELPLAGTRAVTANAGTGKTFTIATLYLRLILEEGLAPEEIVVATFTRAATAELAERIRGWLARADALLSEDDPARPRPEDSAETGVLRGVIDQALRAAPADDAVPPLDVLRARVHGALVAVDTARISTLHGFCFRALAELGFDAGEPLRHPDPIDDLRALDLEIIRDFWRRRGAAETDARLLSETWGDPASLAVQAGDPRWENLPDGFDAHVPEPTLAGLRAELDAVRQPIAAWGDAERAAFEAELDHCVKSSSARRARLEMFDALCAWAREASGDGAAARLDARALGKMQREAIADLQPKGVAPAGQVFDELVALQAAAARIATLPAARAANLLCEARAALVGERQQRLAARDLASQDQAIRALRRALHGPNRDALIARAQERWHAALVDEFQDTDRALWEIVAALFGKSRLVIVGDPKQAIYRFRGGDVFAWQRAYRAREGEPLRLRTSFRSGTALCAAVNALFRKPHAFIEAGIGYEDVEASPRSRACALLVDAAPWPGLRFWGFDAVALGLRAEGSPPARRPPGKGKVKRCLEERTVAHLAWLLGHAELRDRDGELAKLQPKHVAVLVNSNAEAASMQARLALAGIPAASNLQASVYASEEAADLALLLEALADPADADRARAAWASRLAGRSAGDIAASFDAGGGGPQADATAWAAAVARHGVLAWMHRMLATAAPRLLAEAGGARRVANYLQLAELLEANLAASATPAGLAAAFARARADAGNGDRDDADAARLRLETDANAVTVATVHAAKGLEYDVVFLPYAGMGRNPDRQQAGVPTFWYHDGHGDASVALGGAADDARKRAQRETLAEEVRKLYVAVTRARALCVIPWGFANDGQFTALHHLLHDGGPEFSDAGCAAALAGLVASAPGAVDVVPWASIPVAGRYAAAAPEATTLAAAPFTRTGLDRDWTVWSFSRLVRGSHNQAPDPEPGAFDDDSEDGAELGGPRFGTAVHEVLERADFAAWRDAQDVPPSERPRIEAALAAYGLPGAGVPMAHAIDVVGRMIRDALNAPLACGARLADVPAAARRTEIEFHLALAPAPARRFIKLVKDHGYLSQRKDLGERRLAGLLTGRIDLTFRHDGRFFIVDWKTNRCPPYDAAALGAEIARHDYELQWLVYTLAAHRWLHTTLANYDYERDFGGVYYLFVRGMRDGRGVHADRPPLALIDALDALFRRDHREAA